MNKKLFVTLLLPASIGLFAGCNLQDEHGPVAERPLESGSDLDMMPDLKPDVLADMDATDLSTDQSLPEEMDMMPDQGADQGVDMDVFDMSVPEDMNMSPAELFWVGTPPKKPEGAGQSPIVMWPRPSRAHPDVPFVYTMVAYDPEHEQMLWSLDGAPEGMTIDSYGTIRWMPKPTGTFDFDVLVDDGRGEPVRIPVKITVDAKAFLFVAPGGTGIGTIDDPMGDLYAAQEELTRMGGGTLFVRGGTHTIAWTWFKDGVKSPLQVSGSPESQVEIRGFPGEDAIIDCEYKGHGLWAGAGDWTLFADLTITRPRSPERGGLLLDGSHNGAQNVTVKDADWSKNTNCTGFLLRGDQSLCHRCVGIDNYDHDDASNHWNSSNFLTYPDGGDKAIYILDSFSSGSSVGFKIKHAGRGKVLFHGNLDTGSQYGFGGMDDDSIIEFNTFLKNSTGLAIAISDPNEYTKSNMLVHHNTIMNAWRSVWLGDSYAQGGGVKVVDNIFTTRRVLGSRDTDSLFVAAWQYKADLPINPVNTFDTNCYLSAMGGQGFRSGSGGFGDYTWWQEQGFDKHSLRTYEPIPIQDTSEPGPWSIPDDSPCKALPGVGAW